MLQSFIGSPLTFRMRSRFLPWNTVPFWIMLTLTTVLLHMLVSLMRAPYLPPFQPGTPQSGFRWGCTLPQSLPLTIFYLSPLIFNHPKPPLLPIYFWSRAHVHTTVPPEILPLLVIFLDEFTFLQTTCHYVLQLLFTCPFLPPVCEFPESEAFALFVSQYTE